MACGSPGEPPALDHPGDHVAIVDRELAVLLHAHDADGDPVSYSFTPDDETWGDRATVSVTPNGQGVFRFTPTESDIGTRHIDFHASDGRNTSTVTARIEVRPDPGDTAAPRFLRPLGGGAVLDLTRDDCLVLGVRVDDPDSDDVQIALAAPQIAGATLRRDHAVLGTDAPSADDPTGLGNEAAVHAATFRWCPSEAQIEARDRYALILTADDGEHVPVRKELVLALDGRRPSSTGGEPPGAADGGTPVLPDAGLPDGGMPGTSEGDGGLADCRDDGHEDDDDSTRARALPLGSPFRSADNRICAGDEDWFRVELFHGESITVELGFQQEGPHEDLDVYVHDRHETNLTPCCSAEGQSASADERLIFEVDDAACVTRSCAFYVVVRGYQGASNAYDLSVRLDS